MAFSETQRDQIRRYLGFPAAFRDQTYRLESMMDTVGANAVEQASVEAILTEIAAVDTVLVGEAAESTEHGDLKRVEEIEFYQTSQDHISAMKRGKMLIARLSQRLGVPPMADYFGIGEARNFEVFG